MKSEVRQEKSGFFNIPLLVFGVLAVAAVLPYLRIMNTSLLSDDWEMLSHAVDSGKTPIGFFLERLVDTKKWIFYRPLGDLIFAWNWAVSGPNPFFYHVINLSLHVLATFLVWRISLRAFRHSENPKLLAFAAGLVFAVYPRHTQAVSWTVGGRSDLLYSNLVLLGLLCFAQFREGRSSIFGFLTPIILFIGLLAKEAAIVLFLLSPFVFLISEKTGEWNLRKSSAVFAGMLLAIGVYLWLRITALGSIGGYGSDEYELTPFRIAAVLATSVIGSLVPGNFDLFPSILWAQANKSAFLVIAVLLIVLTGYLLIKSASRDLLIGFLIFGIGLLPHLLTGQYVSLRDTLQEHRLYFSSAGTCIVFISILWRALAAKKEKVFSILLVALTVFYTWSLVVCNERWRLAGIMAERIIEQTIQAAEQIPRDAVRIGILGVPDNISGPYIFRVGLREAIRLKTGKDFPILQMAPTGPKMGESAPEITVSRDGKEIKLRSERPYFKFSFAYTSPVVDFGNYIRTSIPPFYADLATGFDITLKQHYPYFLLYNGKEVVYLKDFTMLDDSYLK